MAKLTPFPALKLEHYVDSPIYYAVVLADHTTLSCIISSLPRLDDLALISTESDSLAYEQLVDKILAALDRCDVSLKRPISMSLSASTTPLPLVLWPSPVLTSPCRIQLARMPCRRRSVARISTLFSS
ncbi:hypothetical protein QN277_014375 [Acacia crassicarpa]|uniref:Uncharacterized protein n=1 Tax=Acacia crassicarpa TaxID=499986 RepID=A0AAE1IP13_9FABA|nr:hypothetical protein QN277_014375 [Acacia crassicarpa]